MPHRRLFFIFLSAVAFLSLNGQEALRFQHLGIEDGLSQSCVTSIYQDEFNMIWIGTQDGLNRYNGYEVDVFRPVPGDTTTLFSNNIRTVTGDGQGKLYIICKNGLNEMDLATEKFRTICEDNVMAITHNGGRLWVSKPGKLYLYENSELVEYYPLEIPSKVNCLYETSAGNILIGTTSGVIGLDQNRKEFQLMPNGHVISIYEDSKKHIWVATQFDGLYRIDRNGTATNYRYDPGDPCSLSDNYVRTLCEDDNGNYWIGTFRGVNIFNPETRTMIHADHSNRDPNSLQHSSIWALLKDHQGTLWIGSYYGGVSIYNSEYDFYHHHKELFDRTDLSIINGMTDDGEGGLWIGTEGSGLLRYDPRTRQYKEYFAAPGSISSNNIKSIYRDEAANCLWLGTLLGGVNRMDLRTGRVDVFQRNPRDTASLINNNVRKIIPYGNGLLLATHRGIVRFDPATGKCVRLTHDPEIADKYVADMIVDCRGDCWYSISDGVVRHNLANDTYETYFFDNSPLGRNHILVFFEDSRGRVWLGSSGSGVFLYNPENQMFTNFSTSNSQLVNDYVLDIDESALGYILLTTNGGFVRYDHENGHFDTYNRHNGFPVADISLYGLFVAGNNDIYIAGYKAMVSFNEADLKEKKPSAQIHFTSLKVNNRRVEVGDPEGILQQSLLYQGKIDLYSRHSVFELNYTTSNYIPYMKNEVEYRLIGFDEEWIKGESGRPVVYTNLAPKTYILAVRCVDERTRETLASANLQIEIHPPFYKTAWAYLLLAAIVIFVVSLLLRFYWGKLRLRSSLEMEKREKKQVEELNHSKLQFFTYVSHELRTPVTLIESQLESMLQKNTIPPAVYSKISSLQRNVAKITRLTNELLDFRKQEKEFIRMSFREGNVVELLNKIYITFRDYAAQRHIDFIFESGQPEIPMWFDSDQLEKVFYNLISNAFKFTPDHGAISMHIKTENGQAVVRVSDTGSGIDPAYQENIFNPFFQVPDTHTVYIGTGLGLTVARGIVKAHYGSISLASQPDQGTVFTVHLPLGGSHIPEEQKKAPLSEDELCVSTLSIPDEKFIEGIRRSQEDAGTRHATILIVEDNDELRAHLCSLFEPVYEVMQACDGLDAWRKLGEKLPDIILSDLMMPNVDGNELCSKVKNSFATSHIPFVMLTAKVAVESALEGFRHGADDYISKPFNARILISKCNNLVNARILMQNKFARSTEIRPQILGTNSIDRELIEKAIGVVSANLADPEFGIDQFAREMALGRTKLFTKLKAVTGQTPNEFITNLRLKMSVSILEGEADLSVGEISFMVGFNSPSYFIKSFRSLYGITPTAYRKNFRESRGAG